MIGFDYLRASRIMLQKKQEKWKRIKCWKI
jgi:hypothetical protein